MKAASGQLPPARAPWQHPQATMRRTQVADNPEWAWMDGSFVPFDECRLHVRTQAVAVAAVIFEGIRAYWNPDHQQLYTFVLEPHLQRLRESMKIMRMRTELPADFGATCLELLA